jgi:alkylation response protein AidB-like acyl-CoA dehydrogenase
LATHWLEKNVPSSWLEAARNGDLAELRRRRTPEQYRAWYPAFADSGLVVPSWPTKYGGLGVSEEVAQVVNEVTSAVGLVRLNVIGLGLAGPTLLSLGSEEQRERFLLPLVRNDEIWCQLFSEPGAGSDLASLATRASREGDCWVLNGQKVWSSFAHEARFGLTLARTNPRLPKHKGITFFITDLNAPGVTVRPLRKMSGDSEFNEVFLDDVQVPDSNRVGDVGDGWRVALQTLSHERTMLSGAGSGMRDRTSGRSIERVLQLALAGAGQADSPWMEPGVRQRLATLWIEETVLRLTNLRASQARQRGEQAGAEGSIKKLFQSEHNQRLQECALDLLGARALAWHEDDNDAGRVVFGFLRSRGDTIAGGTSEIQRNVLGERILGLPKDPYDLRDVPWNELPR